jgi:polar amino acid transport system permease protein
LKGLVVTVEIISISLAMGLILSIPLALLRISHKWYLKGTAYIYIFIFRGTPLLVQLFIIYYGLSQFSFIRDSSLLWPILRDPFWCAIIALTLNTTAYTAEIIRGAIQSVPSGQIEAGKSVGMSKLILYRRIVIPQAAILALPGYSNEVILLLKASSLASTVTLMELTGVARTIVSQSYKPIEAFLTAGIIYLVLIFILTRCFMFLEYKLNYYGR